MTFDIPRCPKNPKCSKSLLPDTHYKGHEAAEALAALRSDDSEAFEGDCYPTKPYTKPKRMPSNVFKLITDWFS